MQLIQLKKYRYHTQATNLSYQQNKEKNTSQYHSQLLKRRGQIPASYLFRKSNFIKGISIKELRSSMQKKQYNFTQKITINNQSIPLKHSKLRFPQFKYSSNKPNKNSFSENIKYKINEIKKKQKHKSIMSTYNLQINIQQSSKSAISILLKHQSKKYIKLTNNKPFTNQSSKTLKITPIKQSTSKLGYFLRKYKLLSHQIKRNQHLSDNQN